MLEILGIFALSIPAIIIVLWIVNSFIKPRSVQEASISQTSNSTVQAVHRLKSFFYSLALSILYFFVVGFLNVVCQPDKLGAWGGLTVVYLTLFSCFIALLVFYFILVSQSKSKVGLIFSIFVVSFYAMFLLIYSGIFYTNG